jgi:two-component system, NtrC family, sensor kinase
MDVRFMIIKINFLFQLLILSLVGSSQDVITWQKSDKGVSIGTQLYIFEEINEKFQIEDMDKADVQSKFKKYDKPMYNNSLSDKVHWFKFTLKNETPDQLVLAINQAIIGDITLYFKDQTKLWQNMESHVNMAWHERSIKHHLHNFQLPPSTEAYYLRVESRTTPISLHLWHKSSFERKKTTNLIVLSLIVGFMVFVILYNLFLYFTIRRIEYLIYCFLITGYLLFSLTSTGFINYFAYGTDLWEWYRWIPIILQPIGMIYTLIFLDVYKYPKVFKIGKITAAYFITYIIWNIFLTRVGIGLISQIHALIGMLIMVSIGVYVGRQGNKLGYYFAAAYIMMLLFGTLDVSYINFGMPPYIYDLSHIVIAFLFEVIILSYLLTKRLDWENRAAISSKVEAQEKLMQTMSENERIVKDQNIILEKLVGQRTQELQKSLEDLKLTQRQLIQSEKMASLGELTAGIAHEIQNPLNFVNNFSEVSSELVDEMTEEFKLGHTSDAFAIAEDLKQNLQKITHHGKRADAIVKGMLQHSRSNTGLKEFININTLCEEYLNLAYHGYRAKDKTFNATFLTNFDQSLPLLEIVPQDIGRVILNLINNAFYAVNEKSKDQNNIAQHKESKYQPTLTISTYQLDNEVKISIKDNGTGIPSALKDKIFNPFFTTKPTGNGTGLGLSLSFDIIKANGGTIELNSIDGEGSEFIISVPIQENK